MEEIFLKERETFGSRLGFILVSAGWMDNRYDETIKRFEDTYGNFRT